MKNINTKETFTGIVTTILIGLMGWTAINTHLMLVHMEGYEVGNAKDHATMTRSICANQDEIKVNSDYIRSNSTRLTRLEAIKEEEDDEYFDGKRVR